MKIEEIESHSLINVLEILCHNNASISSRGRLFLIEGNILNKRVRKQDEEITEGYFLFRHVLLLQLTKEKTRSFFEFEIAIEDR